MFQGAFLYAYARDHHIDYYFQDPRFFERYADDIKRLYGQNIPPKTDMVAIHVRRGDYVSNSFYVDLSNTGYYDRAVKEFPNQNFLVFSDNIAFCKRLFNGKEFEFVEGGDELSDLNLMASCTGHIIANSSFSWWGAYLSPYTQKVIYPKDWYTDGIRRTVCPKQWLPI